MRNTKIPIRTQEDAINVISKLKNHTASPAPIENLDFATSTLVGIRSYCKFVTFPDNPYIYAFDNSTETNYSKRWKPKTGFEIDRD